MAIDPKNTAVRPGATQHYQSLISGNAGRSKFIDLVAAKEKHTPKTTSTYTTTTTQDQAAKDIAKAPDREINRLWNKV
jgi:hypothetical protein